MSVGLDIGTKTIKVVELSKDAKKPALKSAGAISYTLKTGIDKMQDEKELADLAQNIRKLLKDSKISSRKISISIPESLAYTRIMKFPLLNDQEIASAVKWEAEEYIPIPVKDAIIEHKILERQEVGNPPQVIVLLVAVLRELVEKYIKILSLINLEVVGVETELMSMTRSLAVPEKTVLILDIGSVSTNIAITKNEELFFSRSIPTAGDAFTRAVAQSLGVSIEQADQYKKAYGLTEKQLEGKVGKALLPIFGAVTEDVRKTIHYYQMETKGEAPATIILTGGSSGMPGVASALTKALNTEVIIGNPFAKVEVEPEAAKNLAPYSPLYSVALGLALRAD